MPEKETLKHYIDGQYIEEKSNRFGDACDPIQGVVAKLKPSLATKAEVEGAIASSQAAFPLGQLFLQVNVRKPLAIVIY